MSATNFSMIWAQLASPYQSSGMVPFVDTDNASITGDVLNFYYNQTTKNLFVTNGLTVYGDVTQAAGASPQTINSIAGQTQIKAGASSVVVNNSTVKITNAIILLQITGPKDATLTSVVVTVGAGQFTVTGNANATAAVNINFIVFNIVTVHP